MQGVTKPAQNWLSENLGDGFSAESEVMDQVETSRGSREGGRREDVSAQGTAQVMKKDNIVLCFSKPSLHANFNSLRHFLPCYPQQQNICGLNIFKSSVFSRLSNTALSGLVFYILNFTRLTVFLCGSKPI